MSDSDSKKPTALSLSRLGALTGRYPATGFIKSLPPDLGKSKTEIADDLIVIKRQRQTNCLPET